MNTLICLLALFCAVKICKLAKIRNSRTQIYLYCVGLAITLSFFIYSDVRNIMGVREVARVERKNEIDLSLRQSFDEAVKIVKIIETSSDKPAVEIIDYLRGETPYMVNRLSTKIDGTIYLLSKNAPAEIVKRMQEKNDLLKKAEDDIAALGNQPGSATAVSRLTAYVTAVKVNAELLARRIYNAISDDSFDVVNIFVRDSGGNYKTYSEINSPGYSGLDVSEKDMK